MSDDLAAWLLEQIAEDERIARTACDDRAPSSGEHWRWEHSHSDDPLVDQPADLDTDDEYVAGGNEVALRSVGEYPRSIGPLPHFVLGYVQELGRDEGRHIARWDPARVLAECEAKREIVRLHAAGEHLCPSSEALDDGLWSVTDQDVMTPCPTLRLLALPLAHHAGYREEWKP